jgi:hypothetical protein
MQYLFGIAALLFAADLARAQGCWGGAPRQQVYVGQGAAPAQIAGWGILRPRVVIVESRSQGTPIIFNMTWSTDARGSDLAPSSWPPSSWPPSSWPPSSPSSWPPPSSWQYGSQNSLPAGRY